MLTARECEVADLLAEGLPDKAIAERLRISRATVRTYVEHIFTKLAVDTRVAVAAIVWRVRETGGEA